ncbi:DHS-like NAD/FAD-binding domain-containing protein [Crepidotus variabilis]|uniref:DHS-like NAD/FAD-binding domain-containing protein n=1 Tax=Crepidotus variabilis TaxID=179855 RepID=A0A9P6JMS1_9AGAR|nr:DHS-like NAD/FAD-binding domain-containing protein [Crepidotus variabilis]
MSSDKNHVMLHAETIVHESEHGDPLKYVDSSAGTASSSKSNEQSRQRATVSPENELLALQIQAFLQASEVVDVDQDVIEDIIQVLAVDDENSKKNQRNNEGSPPDSENQLGGTDDTDEDSDELTEDEPERIMPKAQSMPSPTQLEMNDNDGEEAFSWTKQEVKAMTHLLKERGPADFINEYVRVRNIHIPKLLKAFGVDLCPELQNRQPKTMLYFLRVTMAHVLNKREKLSQHNSIYDAVQLIQKSQRILILTGAGISVSCGIPDFRSKDGLYATLKNKTQYDLDDPQQMFDIDYFRENPAVFYSFASSIYPSNFTPSPCHRFIKLVEEQGKLLRNYTQNIDTLETQVGVKKVLQCHGSFAFASCLQCRRKVPGHEIETEILSQKVPLCTMCNGSALSAGVNGVVKAKTKAGRKGAKKKSKKKTTNVWEEDDDEDDDIPDYPPGIMKPDITFFGEKLTDEFDHSLMEDRFKVDLLLVIGTSLKVSPVAEILSHLPHSIPQILINKTPIKHINPDIILLGNADDIVLYLCDQLHWELPPAAPSDPKAAKDDPRINLKKRASANNDNIKTLKEPKRVGESHVYLFEGAEGGKWLQQLHRELGISIPRSVPPSAPGSGYNTRSSTPALASPAKPLENGKRESKKQRIA